MKCPLCLVIVTAAAVSASIAVAQNSTKPATTTAPPAHGEMQLPPGWTEADMQACIEAGTPGAQHTHLAKSVGVWRGTQKMWMAPGTEPMLSECTSTITSFMDGRYTKCEVAGDMPGMGPFNGFGLYGFDNVSKKFQSTWVDNHGTGMMVGTGELSSDSKTMTWNFNYNCPVTKKPTTMREVEKYTSANTMTLEMYGIEPKSGKEYKMMEIAFTRQPNTTATGSAR